MERNIIKDMCRLKLLKELKCRGKTSGFRKLKIINPEVSSNIDKGVLADILTVGKNEENNFWWFKKMPKMWHLSTQENGEMYK